MIMASFIFT